MKIKFKLLIFGFLSLVVMSFILSNDYEIEERYIINISKTELHTVLEDVRTWKYWMPFVSEKTIIEIPSIVKGKGALIKWQGQNSGRYIIHDSNKDWGIAFSLYFDSFPEKNRLKISYKSVPDGLELTWQVLGINTYPIIGKYIAIFEKYKFKKAIKQGFEALEEELLS